MATPKGKQTYYPNKVKDPVTTTLTQESRNELKRCEEAITAANGAEGPRCSRADLLEHAWRVVRGLPVNKKLAQQLRDLTLPTVGEADSSLGGEPEPAESTAATA